jgi:hypothetical protein
MVPSAYSAYFGGCAQVAGTLIGLLFVAISVSPHKHTGRQAPLSFRVQAGVAFTTLIDALAVALAALLPGRSLGTASVYLACAGISATAGLAVLSLRDWPGRRHLGRLAVIPVLAVLYILQLVAGISLLQRPSDPGPVHALALMLIIFFLIATYRAWQMIGGQSTQLLALAAELVREPGTTAAVPAPPQPAATRPRPPADAVAPRPPRRRPVRGADQAPARPRRRRLPHGASSGMVAGAGVLVAEPEPQVLPDPAHAEDVRGTSRPSPRKPERPASRN